LFAAPRGLPPPLCAKNFFVAPPKKCAGKEEAVLSRGAQRLIFGLVPPLSRDRSPVVATPRPGASDHCGEKPSRSRYLGQRRPRRGHHRALNYGPGALFLHVTFIQSLPQFGSGRVAKPSFSPGSTWQVSKTVAKLNSESTGLLAGFPDRIFLRALRDHLYRCFSFEAPVPFESPSRSGTHGYCFLPSYAFCRDSFAEQSRFQLPAPSLSLPDH